MENNTYPLIDLHTDYVLSCYAKGVEYGSAKQINTGLLKTRNMRVILAGFSYDDLFGDTQIQVDTLLKETRKPGGPSLILSAEDYRRVMRHTSPGLIMHMEGAGILQNSMERFGEYYRAGVRSVGLTHSAKNCLASGNRENPKEGLTAFGKRVVKELTRRHMVVDYAHLNRKGFYDVLSLTTGPVLVSHANTQRYCPDPRNLTDEQIKEVAKRKGVVGVFFSGKYVRNDGVPPSIDDVVKHACHIALVGGAGTVAFGSDFGGITTGLPRGLTSVADYPLLISKLRTAGFNDKELEGICWRNADRVLLQTLSHA